MACKRRKATAGILAPNIQRGGTAIPLGNNLYWMKGRKHNSGGIDIGKDLEVENNEVMQMLPTETRVFSSVKMLGGNSPAELVASGLNPDAVFAMQEQYKKVNRIKDDGTRYRKGGKAKLGKRIKGAEENGSRDIYYDDKQHRWVWGSNRQVLPLGHRVKLDDGYEYQLNSDGSRTRIGKKPNAYERMITSPMQYTPNNDKVEAIGDVLTAPFVDQGETYYNGILPLRNGSQFKDAPLYAYRTGDMSYLKNDDNYIRTIDRSNNPALPRKLYTFYNQDTLYLPSTLIQNLDRLKQGIGMNQENVNRDYIYGSEYKPIIDARNHHMQIRQLDNRKYVADFSDVFDVNDEFFDSKANPIVFSQYGVPVEFTGDSTKWNDSFVGEVNRALGSKKYGGRKKKEDGGRGEGTYSNPYRLHEVDYTQTENDINRMNQMKQMFQNKDARSYMEDGIYNWYNDYLGQINKYYGYDDEERQDYLKSLPTPEEIISNINYLYNKVGHPVIHTLNNNHVKNFKYDENNKDDEMYRSYYMATHSIGLPNDTIFSAKDGYYFDDSTALDNYLVELGHALQWGDMEDLQGEDIPEGYTIPGSTEHINHTMGLADEVRKFAFKRYDNDDMRNLAYNRIHQKLLNRLNKIKEARNKKYGGKMNLQNVTNNSLINNKRMISQNKLGTVVRIDGAGRDRLAYIPSTGSSKQDMKCGGRTKALFGFNYPRFARFLYNGSEDILERPAGLYHNSNGDMEVQTDQVDVNGRAGTLNGKKIDMETRGKLTAYEELANDLMKGQSDVPGYIAAGTNILGSVINGLIANNALNKQNAPVRPIPKIAQKLKTKYNINAQLSEIRNELAGQINNVTRNTASSHTLRNLYNNLGLASLTALNKLHEDKENKETELINKDIINRQTTDHENVEAYNKWLENITNFYNNRSMLRAQNWANMVNGIGSGIGQALGNIGASKRYRNNMLIAMLPYIKAIGNG